jgi:hypothetical protein
MDNLSGFVKMAIITNPNLDNKTVEILCKYVDDLEDSLYVLENQYRVQAEKNDPQENIRRIYRPDQIGWHILND